MGSSPPGPPAVVGYNAAAPTPSLPEQAMPTTRKGTVWELNPNYVQGGMFSRDGGPNTPQIQVQNQDIPVTQADVNLWQSQQQGLKQRYDTEATQEQTLFSSLQNRRRASTGGGGATILTGASLGPPPSQSSSGGGTLGTGNGKTLLGT